MKVAMAAALLCTVALFGFGGASPAGATDMDSYRQDHDRGFCPEVEIHRTNRWGDDVTIHRRVCR